MADVIGETNKTRDEQFLTSFFPGPHDVDWVYQVYLQEPKGNGTSNAYVNPVFVNGPNCITQSNDITCQPKAF